MELITWWKSPDPEPAELPEVLLTRTGTFSRILLSFISRSSSSSSITGGLYSTIDVDPPPLSAFFASINADAVVAATTNLVSPSCVGFPVDILLKTLTRCPIGDISPPLRFPHKTILVFACFISQAFKGLGLGLA